MLEDRHDADLLLEKIDELIVMDPSFFYMISKHDSNFSILFFIIMFLIIWLIS